MYSLRSTPPFLACPLRVSSRRTVFLLGYVLSRLPSSALLLFLFIINIMRVSTTHLVVGCPSSPARIRILIVSFLVTTLKICTVCTCIDYYCTSVEFGLKCKNCSGCAFRPLLVELAADVWLGGWYVRYVLSSHLTDGFYVSPG